MRKVFAAISLLCITLCFAGCSLPRRVGIEKYQNILVAGVDATEDGIVLTVMVDIIAPSGKDGGETSTKVLRVTGKSLLEARRSLCTHCDKETTWAHFKYLIIGEETARKGINPYVDYFMHNPENRMSNSLIIAAGSTAEDFIKNTNDKAPMLMERLDDLFRKVPQLSQSGKRMLLHYADAFYTDGKDPLLPCVNTISKVIADNSEAGKEEHMDVQLKGYALFDGDVMTGYADEEALGISFLLDEVKSAAVNIQTPDGARASLEVLSAKTKIEPDYDNMCAVVKVTMQTGLVEYMGDNPLINDQMIEAIIYAQNEYIKNIILNAIDLLKNVDSDSVGIGNKFYHKDPVKWLDIKDGWKDEFKNMQIYVDVDSVMERTYNIRESLASHGG